MVGSTYGDVMVMHPALRHHWTHCVHIYPEGLMLIKPFGRLYEFPTTFP